MQRLRRDDGDVRQSDCRFGAPRVAGSRYVNAFMKRPTKIGLFCCEAGERPPGCFGLREGRPVRNARSLGTNRVTASLRDQFRRGRDDSCVQGAQLTLQARCAG